MVLLRQWVQRFGLVIWRNTREERLLLRQEIRRLVKGLNRGEKWRFYDQLEKIPRKNCIRCTRIHTIHGYMLHSNSLRFDLRIVSNILTTALSIAKIMQWHSSLLFSHIKIGKCNRHSCLAAQHEALIVAQLAWHP